MSNMPSLRQLQFFIALCDEGNYHRTANNLGVTQPALSAAIKEMENLMGGALIDRTPHKKVIPTQAGKTLLRYARTMLPEYASICDDVRRQINPDKWHIKLGVVPTIAPFLLPHLLPLIHAHMPFVELQVIEATSAIVKQRMENNEIDYAIMAFPYDMPGFHQTTLFAEEFVCALPAGTDPFQTKGLLTTDDLQDHKILLLEDGHCLRSHALEACHLSAAQEQKSLQASSLSTLIQMVAHGQGITLLPDMATRFGALPASVEIRRFGTPPKRHIGVTWRSRSPRAQDYRQLTESLTKALKDLGYQIDATSD